MTNSNLSQPQAVAEALRSRVLAGHGLSMPYARKWEIGGCEPIHSLWSRPYDGLAVLGAGLVDLDVPIGVVEDRKSTRLNSSHVEISYAVFCLKKKKKNDDLIL